MRISSTYSFEKGRQNDPPFNSVIRSARWRALVKTRISVGQAEQVENS